MKFRLIKLPKYLLCLGMILLSLSSCKPGPGKNLTEIGRLPLIDPDYNGINVPYNIAPLNFKILEKGTTFAVRLIDNKGDITEIRSRNGLIRVPLKGWKKMLEQNKGNSFQLEVYSKDPGGKWIKYTPVVNRISADPIDKYLTFRILYPGYESWKEIQIRQRNLETFKEWSIVENSIADQNCVNCHSFSNSAGTFLFHVRGSLGGTCFYDGKNLRKINLKTNEMKNGAVYPRWHPSGRFVAFSSNRIVQQFHSALGKKVEVSDLESSLLLYDVSSNKIMNIRLLNDTASMDTYPEWSPDGKWLYFCRAKKESGTFVYSRVHYNLYRASFDSASLRFGDPELIYNASASEKSASFPRVSPDGRHLVFTLHDYGCFPIWHREADLYSIDLSTLIAERMALNSDLTESYHTWSSNSRWLIFSSKRNDGLTARFFISHIDENGSADKPFILPQKDPEFYQHFIKTFNLPELSTFKVKIAPGKLRESVASKAIQAEWQGNK